MLSEAPANAARGGTRCTSALTVLTTMRPPEAGSSSRVRVATRSETRAGLGATRSYGRQSQAGKRNTSTPGAKKSRSSTMRASAASSRATCSSGP